MHELKQKVVAEDPQHFGVPVPRKRACVCVCICVLYVLVCICVHSPILHSNSIPCVHPNLYFGSQALLAVADCETQV